MVKQALYPDPWQRRDDNRAVWRLSLIDLEIWPSSTLFNAGSKRLVVQVPDFKTHDLELFAFRHEDTRNREKHYPHVGAQYDSYLSCRLSQQAHPNDRDAPTGRWDQAGAVRPRAIERPSSPSQPRRPPAVLSTRLQEGHDD
jgi:hypothetical protein